MWKSIDLAWLGDLTFEELSSKSKFLQSLERSFERKLRVFDDQISNDKILEFQKREVVLALAARSPSGNRRNAAIHCKT